MAESVSEENPRKKRKRKVKRKSILSEVFIVFAGLPILLIWVWFRTFVCWGRLGFFGELFCRVSGIIKPILLVSTLVLLVLCLVDLHKLGDELEDLPKWSMKRSYRGFRSLENWDKFHFLFSFVSFLGALIIGIYLLRHFEFSLF
ncbi:hypothetical protein CH379_011345 [Leptospira ellisii]|uniref:Uncharacterized protein n=2 Tax=Leptospira ellisii TaxID=2023197 RepID=A0A2N0BBB1_9LEPT|nr:hypothetical protein [Leptospira ellisii]MDV6236218.1 hypothetical protein [Leptospira ellisii]PJZ93808.1 hypothetical protein CH379_05860 [Leptospira ellisii]